jgi:mRNA-degrading endonuclease toxin of MazEF toxin-antitoxin module
MPPTIAYRRGGDVVLIEFVFADDSGAKLRPALVISAAAFLRSRGEVVVAAITSNLTRRLFGDVPVAEWQVAGLLYPSSVVTGVLRTVQRVAIRRRLGSLASDDLTLVDARLRASLGL